MDEGNPEQNRRRDPAWRKWGPYLAERQWGTVREDYSPNGDFWTYFTHDDARSRTYRWAEDGIGGVSDEKQRLCFSVAMWNEVGPILKERFFGVTPMEGNHGEDVKEMYYYLDAVPSHAYLKMLYKYPQRAFPYDTLLQENKKRGFDDPEYEVSDTDIFKDDRYFDVFIEYAKTAPDDITMRVTAINRGPDPAPIHLLPQCWYRNTWTWERDAVRPQLTVDDGRLRVDHPELPLLFIHKQDDAEWILTENETHASRVFHTVPRQGFYKDSFHDHVVGKKRDVVLRSGSGTKSAAHSILHLAPGESKSVYLRMAPEALADPFVGVESLFATRKAEADAFYESVTPIETGDERRKIHRQAHAGMIWNKQYYHFDVWKWMRGDKGHPPPPEGARACRLQGWEHLNTGEILSMPDTWEFPWFAAWDSAFHAVTFALTDPDFAKQQLQIFTEDWYMHPNGQIPAYEMAFGDVNPPVHAWAVWKVFEIDREQSGVADLAFLERMFHRLSLNFGWWVNRKDREGNNIFQGGFLGLDNIGVFDRGATLGEGQRLDQADATSWMAMYCLQMMKIAIELAFEKNVYETSASKFFMHFLYIAKAINSFGPSGTGLWDPDDEFYYDVLHDRDGKSVPLRVRSIVGLIPLLAVEILSPETLEKLPEFHRRVNWVLDNRPDLAENVPRWMRPGRGEMRVMSLLGEGRIRSILKRMLDENEFLSMYGIRGLSRYHAEKPFTFRFQGKQYSVSYEPGEGHTAMFGGNSNWRGPIWFPINFLIIEALREYDKYFGAKFTVQSPRDPGMQLTFKEVADEISRRLVSIFETDWEGTRPVTRDLPKGVNPEHWKDYILFHEYFHGDSGRGCGASHQTGWTGLVANLIHDLAKTRAARYSMVNEPQNDSL